MGAVSRLKPGDIAPPFTLKDQKGEEVVLAAFKGRKVLVYFYPKADTPGCTRQACAVRDALNDLKAHGIVALGVSPDPVTAQRKFAEKYHLNFPLLSDTEHKVAEAYGVWGERTMYGKKVLGIQRSAFLVDEEGRIAAAWYGIKPEDTVPKVLEAVKKK